MQPFFDDDINDNLDEASGGLVAFAVSEINAMVADIVQSGFPRNIRVRGEISNLSVASSGHRYFSLKDAQSVIGCALFKQSAMRLDRNLLATLKNGDEVEVVANLSVYKPQGRYQLIVSSVEAAGFGKLAEAFVALKNKLISEGLTDPIHKKPLPKWPQQIAVITSASGAALHDVLTTLKRRAPFIPVQVYPSLVQGDGAESGLLSALKKAQQDSENAVILLVRGGGSLEDLQAFNSEALARAVFNSAIPIVSGVGHETDVSILDFVADVRAPTPTAAAELVSPDKDELLADIGFKYKQLQSKVENHYRQQHTAFVNAAKRLQRQSPQRQVLEKKQQVDDYERLLFGKINNLQRLRAQYAAQQALRLKSRSPQAKLNATQQKLNEQNSLLVKVMQQRLTAPANRLAQQHERLQRLVLAKLDKQQSRLAVKKEKLLVLDPLSVLGRGYAVVFDGNNKIVRGVQSTTDGQVVNIKFSDGEIAAKILKSEN